MWTRRTCQRMGFRMHQGHKKKKPRQLALMEQNQQIPRWVSLSDERRREVVDLLAPMLRNDDVTEEVDDE